MILKRWWLIIVLFLVIYVVWLEPRSQNALRKGSIKFKHENEAPKDFIRRCNNSTPPVTPEDPFNKGVDKTISTLRKNHTLVGWRRALLVGLIVAIPIGYFLYRRFPSGKEFTIITFIVSLVAYFSTVWIDYHWWSYHDITIEKELLKLRNKI